MKNSYEQRVQNQFGGFCTRVLKNEANRILNEYARQRDREKSLDELSPDELAQAPPMTSIFRTNMSLKCLGRKCLWSVICWQRLCHSCRRTSGM